MSTPPIPAGYSVVDDESELPPIPKGYTAVEDHPSAQPGAQAQPVPAHKSGVYPISQAARQEPSPWQRAKSAVGHYLGTDRPPITEEQAQDLLNHTVFGYAAEHPVETAGNLVYSGAGSLVAGSAQAATEPGQRLKGVTKALTGAGEAVQPFIGPAAAEAALAPTVAPAVRLASSFLTAPAGGYAGKKLAQKANLSPEGQQAAEQAGELLGPGVVGAAELVRPRVGIVSTPEVTGGTVSGFGDRVAGGVAVTPEEIKIGGKFGSRTGSVSISRSAAPAPVPEGPTIRGEEVAPKVAGLLDTESAEAKPVPAHVPEAMRVAQQAAQAEAQAKAIVNPPPPAPVPPPQPVTEQHLAPAVSQIQSLPEEQQAPAILQAHQDLTQAIAQGGAVIDGRVIPPGNPKAAEKAATKIAETALAAEKGTEKPAAPADAQSVTPSAAAAQRSQAAQAQVAESTPPTPKGYTEVRPERRSDNKTRAEIDTHQFTISELQRARADAKTPAEEHPALEQAIQQHKEMLEEKLAKARGTSATSHFPASNEGAKQEVAPGEDADPLAQFRDERGLARWDDVYSAEGLKSVQNAKDPADIARHYRERADIHEKYGDTEGAAEFRQQADEHDKVIRDVQKFKNAGFTVDSWKVSPIPAGDGGVTWEAHYSVTSPDGRSIGASSAEHVIRKFGKSVASTPQETKPVVSSKTGGDLSQEQPTKYKFGNTQASIPEGSEAHNAIETARSRISDSDLAGDGKDIGGNHVTVRYGIKGDDTEGIKKYLESQAPFEATLSKTDSFEPSEHSDGAAPIIAPVNAPELHRIEAELDQHGDFNERSFPEYKPHTTLAYVKPEKAGRYKGMTVTDGKKFTVDTISITDRNGNETAVKLKGAPQSDDDIEYLNPEDHVTANASGESPASREAQQRAASEKRQGIKRLRIDTRTGNEVPLFGPDAVDAKVNNPHEIIVERQAGQPDVIVDKGAQARPLARKPSPPPSTAGSKTTPPTGGEAVSGGNADRFRESYIKHLKAALQKNPQDYKFAESEAPRIADKMMAGLQKGTANKDGAAIKATLKELGIKNTYAAIKEYLNAKPAEAAAEQSIPGGFTKGETVYLHGYDKPVTVEGDGSVTWANALPGPRGLVAGPWGGSRTEMVAVKDADGHSRHVSPKDLSRQKGEAKSESVAPTHRAFDLSNRTTQGLKEESDRTRYEIEAIERKGAGSFGRDKSDLDYLKEKQAAIQKELSNREPQEVQTGSPQYDIAKADNGKYYVTRDGEQASGLFDTKKTAQEQFVKRADSDARIAESSARVQQPIPGGAVTPVTAAAAAYTPKIGDIVEHDGKRMEVGFLNSDGSSVRLQDPETHERLPGWFSTSDLKPWEGEAAPAQEPVHALINAIYGKLEAGESLGNVTELNKLGEQYLGASRVSGEWTPKDLFDAMETAVNKYLIQHGDELMKMHGIAGLAKLRELMPRLTSQGIRTEEQIKNQQFSTPPTESYVVAKVANLKPSDVVLEPSAGNGGLAVWPKAIGAEVHVNEIAPRRQKMLEAAGFNTPTGHDGELINALLDHSIQPTVILMNPPFSASTTKSHEAKNLTRYGFNHVEQALQRLAPGGRLVTILGGGRDGFQASEGANLRNGEAGRWFEKVADRYNVRANIRVDGKEYQKYGTSYATRIIVIDKDGPTPSRTAYPKTWDSVIERDVNTLEEAYNLLKPVEESRPQLETRSGSSSSVGQREGQAGSGVAVRPGSGVPGVRGVPGGSPETHGEVPATSGSGGARSGSAAPRPGSGNQQLPVRQPEASGPQGSVEGAASEGVGVGAGDDHDQQQVAERGRDLDHLRKNLETARANLAEARRHNFAIERNEQAVREAEEALAKAEGHSTIAAKLSALKPLEAPKPEGDALNLEEIEAQSKIRDEEEDSAYTAYQPTLKGATHPGSVVETKAMATVPMPPLTYKPNLPESVIGKGPDYKDAKLSAVQLEAVSIAGMQNDIVLPGGFRASALIGDGTGIGKGREGAAIIWDNWRKGRRRLLWMSKSNDLSAAAMRDLKNVGATDLSKNLLNLRKVNGKGTIDHTGVLYSTYALARSGAKGQGARTRIQQIEEWLRGNDDGDGAYLLMDESHQLKNAVVSQGSEASQQGIVIRELLQRMPKLRTVSLSATAATDVMNLGYLDRLGLWGPGTPFPNGFNQFAGEISNGGMSAMEMVAREMKAQGKYVSRTLTYKGITYSQPIHELTPEQKEIYKTATKAWENIVQSIEHTITHTTNGGGRQKARAMSVFYATQQRFFNLLLTSIKIPTAVRLAQEALADGKAVAITLINTNEAAQNRERDRVAAESDEEQEVPDYDFGPGRMLRDLVMEHYPTQQYRDDVDQNGKPIKVPVVDASGNPVLNPEAVQARDALVAQLDRDLHMPSNPLDELIEQLGGHKKVAELTGRKQRLDPSTGRLVNRAGEGVSHDKVNLAEAEAFQSGRKDIAVVSSAADTGIDLHADASRPNPKKRLAMTLQIGWSADKALQMNPGRFNRSNQAHAPEVALLQTNLGGEARFISSIARRMQSLEAVTKGQTNTNAGTEAMSKVNFETDQGRAAAVSFYTQLLRNGEIPGTDMRGMNVLRHMGVLKAATGGGETVPPADRQNITRLLNRILAFDPDTQQAIYDYFYDIFEAIVKQAEDDGTLDTGVKRIPGDEFKIKEMRHLASDPVTGAKTFYYPVDAQVRVKRMDSTGLKAMLAKAKTAGKAATIYRSPKGKLALAIAARPLVHADGSSEDAVHILRPDASDPQKVPVSTFSKWEPVDKAVKDKLKAADEAVEDAKHSIEYNGREAARMEKAKEEGRYFTPSTLEYYQKALAEAQQELKDAQKNYDEVRKEVRATKPFDLAKDGWQKQHDDSPTHRTTEHHLIGGAVMRYWNAIRESTGQRLDVYSALDKSSGERVVGIEIPASQIQQLVGRIAGGKSTVNASQILSDVLKNATQYSLEGGVTVRRGRVAGENVVQLITANADIQTNLKSKGVLYERGIQPIYYLPKSDSLASDTKAEHILEQILKEYPAKVAGSDQPAAATPDQPEATPATAGTPAKVSELQEGDTVTFSKIPPGSYLSPNTPFRVESIGNNDVRFRDPKGGGATSENKRTLALADFTRTPKSSGPKLSANPMFDPDNYRQFIIDPIRRAVRSREPATYNGKPFYVGAVDPLDGKIEAVSDHKATAVFRHRGYFSPEISDRLDRGSLVAFFVEPNGSIRLWSPHQDVKSTPDLLDAIRGQIRINRSGSMNASLFGLDVAARAGLRGIEHIARSYDQAIGNVIDKKLQVGDKYWKAAEQDPQVASLLHEVDNAPRYAREKAAANIAKVTKWLSEKQIRLARLMADPEERDYLKAEHPDEYQNATNDAAVMKAVADLKPLQEQLGDWREALGWPIRKTMTMEENENAGPGEDRWTVNDRDGNPLDSFKTAGAARDYIDENAEREDHVRRTYPEHMRQSLPGETDTGPYTGIFHEQGIRPPKMDKKARVADAEYFYQHGAKDFSGYLESYTKTYGAIMKQQIFDRFSDMATPWKAGTAKPPQIEYLGKTYYRPDIAAKMREGKENPVKSPLEYQVYDPSRGERFLIKNTGDEEGNGAWSTLSTGKPGIGPNDRYLGPREVVAALENYDKGRGGEGSGAIRKWFQTQIVGLFGPAVHINNIVRRVSQAEGFGAFDPRSWRDIARLMGSKELRERVLSGAADETVDMLMRHGAYTDWRDIGNLHTYIGGNLNPLNWHKYGKGVLFDPTFAKGWGGLDPKARVLVADYLKQHAALTDSEIAHAVNDALGDYNRANWTERQRMLSRFTLFPGWDFASVKWFLRHPFTVGFAGAVAVLIANRVMHALGQNKEQDKNDLGAIHIGDRQYRPGMIIDSFGGHMAQPVLNAAQTALNGGDKGEIAAAAGEGMIRAGAGFANMLRPDLQLFAEQIMNRRQLGGGKEIVSLQDRYTPGTVLPNRALEKRAVFAAIKAFPAINRFLDVEQEVDWKSGVGSALGVMNSKHDAESRLKANAARATGYTETLSKLAESNPEAAEKVASDPRKAVYLMFHNDLAQMVQQLREIDKETERVKLSTLTGDERKQALKNLADARSQVLGAADQLNDALSESEKQSQQTAVPEPTPRGAAAPAKGDTVKLKDGSMATVRFVHPAMGIARVAQNGKTSTMNLKDLQQA